MRLYYDKLLVDSKQEDSCYMGFFLSLLWKITNYKQMVRKKAEHNLEL